MSQALTIVHTRQEASDPRKVARSAAQVAATTTATTAAPGDSSTAIATTAFVTTAITAAGAGYQPLNAALTTISGQANTTFGLALLTAADAVALRGTLSVYSIAQTNSAITTALAPYALTASLGSLAYLSTINGGNWSGLDLAIADGGTGASSAAAARTNLSLYSSGETDTAIATAISAAAPSYQPVDSDLTAIAALSTTTFGRSLLTQADAAAARSALGAQAAGSYQPLDADLTALAALTTTSFGLAFNTLANGAAALSYIGAQAAGSYQPLATPLTALAGVTPAANTFAYFTSGTAATTAALTAQGRGLLDDVTAADNRVTIGVDQRTAVGDAAYAILATDRFVSTSAAFTAARTWTLPAANSVNAGGQVTVADGFGTVTTTNSLTIARAGSDLINGAATGVVLTRPYRAVTFISDGVSRWTIDAQAKLLDTANTWTASQTQAIAGGGISTLFAQGEAGVTVSSQRFSTNNLGPNITLVKARGTIAAPSAVVTNDALGGFNFLGYDGAANRTAAQIQATVIAATPSSTDMQARVFLNVCASGAGAVSELARWDHATGFSLYGTQVVTARQTGFAAATGTAAKGTFATYATGTAGAAYTQAEMQAVRDALQVAHQQIKALKDALITHGLIGT